MPEFVIRKFDDIESGPLVKMHPEGNFLAVAIQSSPFYKKWYKNNSLATEQEF